MVFFICNSCGDSLKKNKVEQHAWKCHTNSVACVDCQKDFSLNSYAKHNECITEDQKYGGQNYQQKEFKGKSKQNNWINGVKSLCDKNNYPKNVQNILRSLTSYENVPRKKAKFLNFVKNSFRLRDDVLANEVWNLIESELKNNNNGTSQTNGNNDTKNGNENSNGIVRKLEDAESDKSEEANNNKKLKTEETPDQNTEKIKMKKVIKEVLSNYEEIELTKLRKKVLKFYKQRGYAEDKESIKTKFDKIINRHFVEHEKIKN